MKGFRIAWILFVASVFLIGCHHQSTDVRRSERFDSKTTKIYQKASLTGPFTELESSLPVDVEVVTGRPSHFMIVGMSKEMPSIEAGIVNGRLHLDQILLMTAKERRHIHVKVEMPQLTTVVHHGSGHLHGKYVKGDYVTIRSTGSGSLDLSGPMTLQSLTHLGTGDLSLKGVQGNPLFIRAHSGGVLSIDAKQLDLSELNQRGHGRVSIQGLRTTALEVSAGGEGSLELSGLVGLKSLTHNGGGSVSISKVSGEPSLHLAGHGSVTLKGVMTLKDPMVYRGGDDVVIENVYDPYLDVIAAGTGNLTIKGKVGLHSLRHTGSGKVTIGMIDSSDLSLDLGGSGATDLVGTAALKSLVYNSSGDVKLYWIDSPEIKISGHGSGHVFLAGKTETLDVNMGGKAKLDLEYLSSLTAYVKTKKNAIARINARGSINNLALGHSHIYMYKDSNFMAYYNSKGGSNIRVAGLGLCSPETLCLGGGPSLSPYWR